jgi:hypothetical protein
MAAETSAASPPTAPAGSLAGRIPSSFLIKFSAACSANYSWYLWERPFAKASSICPANFAIWPSRPRSRPCVKPPLTSNGWFTSSLPSVDPGACSSIWLATLIASPSPTTGFALWKTAASAWTGKTTRITPAPRACLSMRSNSSAAFCSTCCLPAWSAFATSSSSPIEFANKN